VAVWQESLRRIQKLALMDLDSRGLLRQLWNKLEAVEFDEALTTLRLIWFRRNAYVFYRGFSPPSQLISEARLDLLGYKEAQERPDKENAPRSPMLSRWTRPPRGWMKANWAAAIGEGRKQMGLGVVVRDAGGGFVAAMSKIVPFISDSTSAEAIAAWESVKFCETQQWHQVLFEGDSSAIASALTHDLPCLQSFGHLIANTRHLLGRFHSYKIQHVQRSANQVAYLIAKGAFKISSDVSWMEVCPPFIHSFVVAEQATSE
jgi:ribonuclease HI